jgi:serine O-acetyltransferase
MFDNIKYDFRRELENGCSQNKIVRILECFGQQGFQAVMGYRICRWLMLKHIPLIPIFIQRFIEITTGISIPPKACIGKGLLIYHFGGIVINPEVKIGDNCTLHHGVTIGNIHKNINKSGDAPVLGNNVYLGAGAKILGEITIGDNCKIGANAVVITSIPAGATAVGIPARITNK